MKKQIQFHIHGLDEKDLIAAHIVAAKCRTSLSAIMRHQLIKIGQLPDDAPLLNTWKLLPKKRSGRPPKI